MPHHNIYSTFMIETFIISKHWEENFVVYVQKKTGIRHGGIVYISAVVMQHDIWQET